MSNRSKPPRGRGVNAASDSAGGAASSNAVRARVTRSDNGSRALPGKASRGSLHCNALPGFSPLGRAILEKIDRGIVLLDIAGAVVDANSIGRQVIENGNGVFVRSGRFSFADAAVDARFERLLKSSGKADGAPRVVAASVKRAGSATCRVLVSPLLVEAGDTGPAAYIAVIYAPSEQREIAAEVLLEIYGLTRAQADVARHLYAGLSVEETATELKLSLNTVRTHLKQIFSKCEVQSQAELLHALALGPQSF
jgi:DNA-binding CsgD family transcriptional regulator